MAKDLSLESLVLKKRKLRENYGEKDIIRRELSAGKKVKNHTGNCGNYLDFDFRKSDK